MNFTKDQIQKIFNECHKDIIKFSKVFLSHHVTDETPEFHKEIFDLLSDDSVQKKAVIAPREHAKSTIANLIFLFVNALSALILKVM